jgi:hypothetical protein
MVVYLETDMWQQQGEVTKVGDATWRGGEICSRIPSYTSSCWKAIYLYISEISLSILCCVVEFQASKVKQNSSCRMLGN